VNTARAEAAFMLIFNINEEKKETGTKSALVDEGIASSVNAICK
jgi:hypothetical protein